METRRGIFTICIYVCITSWDFKEEKGHDQMNSSTTVHLLITALTTRRETGSRTPLPFARVTEDTDEILTSAIDERGFRRARVMSLHVMLWPHPGDSTLKYSSTRVEQAVFSSLPIFIKNTVLDESSIRIENWFTFPNWHVRTAQISLLSSPFSSWTTGGCHHST